MLEALRDKDREAYIATLFLPAQYRDDIATLWVFNAEIERIQGLVSEPVAGEIRLQWWRDVLSGQRTGEGAQHPVARALLAVIERHQLPSAAFDNLLEARIFDFYNDPMPDQNSLEGYLGETRSVLFQMGLQIIMGNEPENGEAAGHAGVAFGIAHILRHMAFHRRRAQVFVPNEILQIGGMNHAQFLEHAKPEQMKSIISALTSLGREHLNKANEAISSLDKQHRMVFQLLAICRLVFDRADKNLEAVATVPMQISQLQIQWHMLLRSLKGQ